MAHTSGASPSTNLSPTSAEATTDQPKYSYLGVVELSPLIETPDDERCRQQEEGTKPGLDKRDVVNGNGEGASSLSSNVQEEIVAVRSIEERIIDQLDHAQLCGDITRQANEETRLVSVEVSTNGVKFLSAADQRAVERLAMHKIVQCLSYENEIGSCNVAVVVTKNDSNLICCHLLQTESHDEADHLCEQISNALQSIEQEASAQHREDRERRRLELEQKRKARKAAQ